MLAGERKAALKMSKGIFITATGTDVGKTYITALLVKRLRQEGFNAGYYKAALSGAESIGESDAGYVNRIAGIGQEESSLVSYLYKNAVSPHLAAKLEGNPPETAKIKADYDRVTDRYDYVVAEGSGGIVCPIRWDESEHTLLEDIIKLLELDTLIVADAGLGTINSIVLTAEYLKSRNIRVREIILNRFGGTLMEEDNGKMAEALTGIPVIARVGENAENISVSGNIAETFFG